MGKFQILGNHLGCSLDRRRPRLQLACFWKCARYLKKFSIVIHPDGWVAPAEPGGAPWSMRSCQFTHGKIRKRGSWLPHEFTAEQTVTSCPLSPDVTFATYLAPFSQMIFKGLWTVVTPVSSRFQIFSGVNWCFSIAALSFSKKVLAVCLLNAVLQARLVTSGLQRDKLLFLSMKLLAQSQPALLFTSQEEVVFLWFALANS